MQYYKIATAFLSVLLFSSPCIYAQTDSEEVAVTFKLINNKKEPVSFYSIVAIARPDSTTVFNKVADSSGIVILNLIKNKQYLIKITSVNYQALEKGITIGNKTTFSFTAEPSGKILETALVVSKKPLIRQEDDKMIVEPENLIAASTNGYEVIEKTPGLFVDQDGNIFISSMTPAAVQINGRDTKMSAPDVATMLKSLPANAIAKIEIVRTPSAKYDASSTGGIVNVVLKKGVKIGMTGSVNTGAQQGNYGNQFAGFNLNNNDGKRTSSLNLNYSKRNFYEKIETDRFFAPDSVLNQKAFTKYPSDNYFASYSFAFPAGKKWDNDISTSLSLSDFTNTTENQSVIKKISNSQIITDNLNKVANDGTTLNFRSAVSGKLKIDSLGSEWVNDIFFNFTKNKTQQAFNTDFTTPFIFTTAGDGTGDNTRNHFNIQSDIKLKLKKKFTLETGAKASFLSFKSITNYFKEVPAGNRQKDIGRTNTFNYNENINSLYIQGSKTLGKDVVVKFGTRLENTNMEGRQIIPDDTTFNIQRTDLFPYVYLSKSLMKIAGYSLRGYLVYRRTITRPVYEQLNPFPKYLDQYLSEIGNPSLRPQFTKNYEANISVDERPVFAVGVNDTKDIFSIVTYQADSSQSQAYRTYDNLGKNKEWYFRGLGALPPGGKYFFVLGAQYNYNIYDGLYEGKPLSFKKGTWTFFTYQTLEIDKRSVITLNGFIRLKGQQMLYELDAFGSLNTSINRKFLKDKLIITLSLTDIFATNQNSFMLKQGSVNAEGFRRSDTRRAGINLRYNFGMRKKEAGNNIFNADPPLGN